MGKAAAAARALAALDEREGRPAAPVVGYFCVRCRGYHVGHLSVESR
jgi:hypothetical protein